MFSAELVGPGLALDARPDAVDRVAVADAPVAAGEPLLVIR